MAWRASSRSGAIFSGKSPAWRKSKLSVRAARCASPASRIVASFFAVRQARLVGLDRRSRHLPARRARPFVAAAKALLADWSPTVPYYSNRRHPQPALRAFIDCLLDRDFEPQLSSNGGPRRRNKRLKRAS